MLDTPITIYHYLVLCSALFSVGLIGVLVRRNSLVILMCIELMLSAISLLLVAFSKLYPNGEAAQIFVLFVMVVAAAEVTVGLAIIVSLYRVKGSINMDILHQLKY